MKTFKLLFGSMALLIAIISVSSCEKDQGSTQPSPGKPEGYVENDMVMYWNDKASVVLTDAPLTPPAQSRSFAMIQIAVHDALNCIKPKFETFALKDFREKKANADAAVASAAYWAIKGMNLQGTNPIDDWYNESLALIPDNEGKELGKALGQKAAEAIIANRAGDNFAVANQQVPVPDGIAPGEYRSTLPFSNEGMPKIKALHQWGTMMTPFVTKSNDQFRPEAPYSISSKEYLADYNEVKEKGARVGHTRTNEEDEIGKFWVEKASIAWNRFARNIIATNKTDAWYTARLFALLHTAMVDGISGCFEAKYHYFFWRPETAIRLGNDDGIDNTTGDPAWLPSYTESPNLNNPALNVNTPPLPDYPSAHSNFGGSASEILRLFYGTDNISVDQTSLTTPGVTRHYSKLSQAARDNSLSRIYVGYHFRHACLQGEEQGQKIANYVFNNSFRRTNTED